MTNNFREEYNTFVEDTRMYCNYDEVLSEYVWKFISNLLTKKDQEHKAELESIKEEIKLFTPSPREINYHNSYNEGQIDFSEHTISILDSHINKLSTE